MDNSQSLLIDTPVRAKLKSVSERRKIVTTGRTAEVLYTPISFGGGINILSKMNKKSTYPVKVPFFFPLTFYHKNPPPQIDIVFVH
jgi:hypothetical protein